MSNLMDANREWISRPADERYETLPALLEATRARRLRSRQYTGPRPKRDALTAVLERLTRSPVT